ncbi:MAG: peroxiredoxin family protein [Bacteroides sp.]
MAKKTFRHIAVVFICISYFTLGCVFAQGHQVVITGSAPDYKGQKLSFFVRTDYITQQQEILATDTVAADGSFRLKLPVFETQLVLIELGVYLCYLYVEPRQTYEVSLPPRREKTESERLNPYFDPIVLQLRNLRGKELAVNDIIARFDAHLDSLSKIILPRLAEHDSLVTAKRFIAQLEEYPISPKFAFACKYKEYRIGLMKYMTEQLRIQGLSKEYFRGHAVLHRNPAYMELFNIVYDKYLVYHGRTEDGQEIYNAISKERNYTKLRQILAQNDHLVNDSLQELVILKGLYDEFYSDHFSRNALFAILDSIYNNTPIAEHANIAQQIRERISKLLPGFIPHSFTLKDAMGKNVRLTDFRGSLVLLCFCTTTSYSCLQDFELLARYNERYGSHLKIVAICADQDSASMCRFVEATHYPWSFLHYGAQPSLLVDYDIRTYPTYFLLDTDGRILHSPAPGPQENLERIIHELFRSRKWLPSSAPKKGGSTIFDA